jgi:hypothetical protein
MDVDALVVARCDPSKILKTDGKTLVRCGLLNRRCY